MEKHGLGTHNGKMCPESLTGNTSNIPQLRMGPVNVFKNYIFEINAFKGKNEACLSFLENIFTKSVHRGGVG